MDPSIFPRGKYYAKTVTIRFKKSSKKSTPFAIEFVGGVSPKLWDINSFRPDPRKDGALSHAVTRGTKATVLYENANCIDGKCYKVPRYIFIEASPTSPPMWYVNVR